MARARRCARASRALPGTRLDGSQSRSCWNCRTGGDSLRLVCTRGRAATAVEGLLDASEQDHTVILADDEVERAARALERAATLRARMDWSHDTVANVLDGRGQLTDAINQLVQHG